RRLVDFMSGELLERLLVIVAIFNISPLAFLVGGPERAAAIHNLFSVFNDDRFDIDAAGRRYREIVRGRALTVRIYIRGSEFALVQNVIDVLVLVAVI